MNFRSAAIRVTVGVCLLSGTTMYACAVHILGGAGGGNALQDANNWSQATRSNASINDTTQWDNAVAGNLPVTNLTGGTFDSNPVFYTNVTTGRTGSLTISKSITFTAGIWLTKNLGPMSGDTIDVRSQVVGHVNHSWPALRIYLPSSAQVNALILEASVANATNVV